MTIAVTGCVTLYVAWLSAHDELVATRAVANERLADFEQSNARADSLHKLHLRTDSQVAVAQSHISQLRRAARAQHDSAESDAHEASERLASAGDSLTATLDSLIRVVPPELEPLTRTARRQHREEQRAHQSLATALHHQLAATQDMLTASDSTIRLQERRYGALEDAYEARVEACRECRETVEAMAAGQGSGWSTVHKLTAGVALLAVGYVAGAGF